MIGYQRATTYARLRLVQFLVGLRALKVNIFVENPSCFHSQYVIKSRNNAGIAISCVISLHLIKRVVHHLIVQNQPWFLTSASQSVSAGSKWMVMSVFDYYQLIFNITVTIRLRLTIYSDLGSATIMPRAKWIKMDLLYERQITTNLRRRHHNMRPAILLLILLIYHWRTVGQCWARTSWARKNPHN